MTISQRKQIKSLLKKGTLSGSEVASIIMYQTFQYGKMAEPEIFNVNGKPPTLSEASLLSEGEVQILMNNNLKDQYDKIAEYYNWLNSYGSFLSVIKSANILYLQIQNLISNAENIFKSYLMEKILGKQLKDAPKQYFINVYLTIKYKICLFLFERSLANILTDITGINFAEQPNKWFDEIENSLAKFLNIIEAVTSEDKNPMKILEGDPTNFDIDELKIDSELESKIRERLNEPLERNIWYYECLNYFTEVLQTMLNTGVFTVKICV